MILKHLHLPREEAKLLAHLLAKLLIFNLCINCIECEQGQVDGSSAPIQGPNDYAYSPRGSRVRDLASFFERMAKLNSGEPDADDDGRQNVIISLSEAASKLHVLSAGYSLDIKCSKYVKLIDRPNIRTFGTVNLLMKEAKMFNEMEQTAANLVARLANERGFDPLGKLQIIIQTLESERENMRSILEPAVQKDLLDCMNYYIYRHQRAISGITYYVRKELDKLSSVLTHPVDLALRKFQKLMDDTLAIEAETSSDNVCHSLWIDNLSKLHSLMLENQFEVPVLVQEFVTNTKRLSRLNSCNEGVKAVENLEQQLLEMESSSPDITVENTDYKQTLIKLREIGGELENDLLHNETQEFLHDSKRRKILEGVDVYEDHVLTNEPQVLKVEPQFSEVESQMMLKANPLPELESLVLTTEPQNLQTTFSTAPPVDIDNKQEVHNIENSVVSSGGDKTGRHQLITQAKQECLKFSIELNDNLRLISWRKLKPEKAMEIAKSLNEFVTDCASSFISQKSHWSIGSMTKKLSSWCLRGLKNDSLADGDRKPLLSVLDTLSVLYKGYKNKEGRRLS